MIDFGGGEGARIVLAKSLVGVADHPLRYCRRMNGPGLKRLHIYLECGFLPRV